MALVTVSMGKFNNDLAEVSYRYDDVTHTLMSFITRNDGPSGTLTYTVYQPDRVTPAFSGTRAANTGTVVDDVSAFGIQMVQGTNKLGQAVWNLPRRVSLGFSTV